MSTRRFVTVRRLLAVVVSALVLVCSTSAAADTPTGDPSANRELSSATLQACSAAPLGAACVASALADINAARVAEGVVPMTLPGDFDSLTVPEQLLVLANLERVDRGLLAVTGLSANLDSSAAAAAVSDNDPPLPPYGGAASANWAGGYASPLEADFLWMYDDGLGSNNDDCTSAGDPGCWGHRHDILLAFDPTLMMGAGVAGDGASLTEVFVGNDPFTGPGEPDAPLAPTWAQIAQTLPVGASTASLDLAANAPSAPLKVWASGESMDVGAAITGGGGAWRVSPSGCDLAAGSSCELTVTVSSAGRGSSDTLTLTGPGGQQTVALASQAPATLKMTVAKSRILAGSAAAVTGHLAVTGGSGAAGQPVTLDQRAVGAKATSTVASARTRAGGSVSFRVSPRRNTDYTLVFAGSPTLGAASAQRQEVQVAPRIKAVLARRAIALGHATKLTGSVSPAESGRRIQLELEHGRRWKAMGSAAVSRSGRFGLSVRASSAGRLRYRVVIPADSENAPGVSATVTLRVT